MTIAGKIFGLRVPQVIKTMPNGAASFPGLCRCDLDAWSGRCKNPQMLADGCIRDGKMHYGIPLANLQFDGSQKYACTW